MSYYGIVFPEFWTGPTGTMLRRTKDRDACILALYLTSARRANMIGLYHLPLGVIPTETPLDARAVRHGLRALGPKGVDFAQYDEVNEFVWIHEMARIRLGLNGKSDALQPTDKRVAGVNRLYAQLPENAFLEPFYDRYYAALHLAERRQYAASVVSLVKQMQGKGLRRGLVATG